MPLDQAVAKQSPGFKDWPAVFDRYDVQYLVLDIHEDGELLRCFRPLPQWGVSLEDGTSVLLARSAAGSNGLARGR